MPQRKTISSLLTVAVVVITITGGVVGGTTAAQPKPPQNVFGQVTDQTGEAVDNATVEFLYQDSVVESTTTDSNGDYDVNVPDPDDDATEEDITVRVQGTDASETVTWSSGDSAQVDLELGTTLPHEISGTVTDQNDVSMSDETVEVVYDGTVVNETTTASDGSYSVIVEDPDTEVTDEPLTVRVANYDAIETLAWESNGDSEANLTVETDTVAGDSEELDEDGSATVSLGTSDVDDVSVNLGSGTSGTVSVSQASGPTDGAPEPTDESVAVYLDIDVPAGSSGTVTVTVAESSLDNAGVAPENASVLHYDGSSWNTLDTEYVGSTGGDVTLRADVDSFSPFAIGGTSDGDDGTTTTTATTTATGTATTTDSSGDDGGGDDGGGSPGGGSPGGGDSDGDGTDDTTTSTVDDGTTATTSDAGTTDDTSTDTTSDAGTTDDQTTTDPDTSESTDGTAGTTDDGDDGDDDDDGSGGGIPGFGTGVALVAVLAAALLALRRE